VRIVVISRKLPLFDASLLRLSEEDDHTPQLLNKRLCLFVKHLHGMLATQPIHDDRNVLPVPSPPQGPVGHPSSSNVQQPHQPGPHLAHP
jgi:hypothetical protein